MRGPDSQGKKRVLEPRLPKPIAFPRNVPDFPESSRIESPMNECPLSTIANEPVSVAFVEGFRALAYEILTWRNPRAAYGGLWGKGLRCGSGEAALPVR